MDVINALVVLVLGPVGGFLASHFREKGKNFATKEDIAQITDAQKRVETEWEVKLEKVKADIHLSVSEHEVRYEYLYKRRREIVDELYKHMNQANRLLLSSVRGIRLNTDISPDQERIDAFDQVDALSSCYNQNRLYLDPNLNENIDKLLRLLLQIALTYGHLSSLQSLHAMEGGDVSFGKRVVELVDKATSLISNDLPPLCATIEAQMKTILGADAI